jgi:hypothetical protein
MVYIFVLSTIKIVMTTTKDSTEVYATSVHVSREVQHALKAEQARRLLKGDKRPTLIELASELLTKAALALTE